MTVKYVVGVACRDLISSVCVYSWQRKVVLTVMSVDGAALALAKLPNSHCCDHP